MILRVLYFGSYDRGVGRNAVLIEGLRAAGVAVHECHTPLWRDTTDKLRTARRPAHAVGAGLRLAAAWARLAAEHSRAGDYDVMVVGATAHLDLPLARQLARQHGRPLVFDPLVSMVETVRDRALMPAGTLRLAALTQLERALFQLPDLCLVDTTAHAAAFTNEVGLDPDRVVVLPAGTPSVYRHLAQPYDPHRRALPIRVVYFGQFIPLHGLETVLAAAERLRGRPDVLFELVGVGQMLRPTQILATRLGLTNVRLHAAWLSPERLAGDHIASADVCLGVFGRQSKASRVVPYKVFTSLASGRPVVTADTPAVREFLRPGEEVWTVPAADPAALATAIARLADDPDLRRRLAAAGQSAYDARFAPAVLGARLRDVLRELVGPAATVRRGRDHLGGSGGSNGPTRAPVSPPHGSNRTPPAPPTGPYTGPRHTWRVGRLARALLGAAPAGPLLDAGCGYGRLASQLAAAGRMVIAFDPDPSKIALAHDLARAAGVGSRLLLVRADATAIPLTGGTIAGAAAGEVLEHIRDDRAAARELARVLVAGGALAITVPAGSSRFGPADRAAGHVRRYDRAELGDLLATAGLSIAELGGWGWPFGRLYDRLIQRPALAVRGRGGGRWAIGLARNRWIAAPWLALFALEEQLPAGERGSGWLAVARRFRKGYDCPPVVIGATMKVRKCAFSSSGDTTTHGRVFWISLPSVGSRLTRYTSPRRTGAGVTSATRRHRSR